MVSTSVACGNQDHQKVVSLLYMIGRYLRTRKMHHTMMVMSTPMGSLREVWLTSGNWQCWPLNPAGHEHTYPVCICVDRLCNTRLNDLNLCCT